MIREIFFDVVIYICLHLVVQRNLLLLLKLDRTAPGTGGLNPVHRAVTLTRPFVTVTLCTQKIHGALLRFLDANELVIH